MNGQAEEHVLDSQLWENVLRDEASAFEEVVLRYQNAVSAVAYSIVGDFALCQDVAQETFWQAWRGRHGLQDRGRLGAWLCAIARNLSHQALRRKGRGVAAMEEIALDAAGDAAGDVDDPVLASITVEESELVWSALENIPEIYRETLVLFYREGESLSDVAEMLDITVDAVKQRLSRGREMLRGQLMITVEGVLQRTRPSRAFTSKVMAGVAALTVSMKAMGSVAGATATGVTAPTVASGITLGAKTLTAGATAGAIGGIAGGLLGSGMGLGGAYLGSWLPAQLAPTRTERELLLRSGKKTMLVSVLFTIAILGLSPLVLVSGGAAYYFAGLAIATTIFIAYVVICSIAVAKQVRQIRMALTEEDDPNDSYLRQVAMKRFSPNGWEGRRYTTRWRFLGLPLIDIQFQDPSTVQWNPEKPLKAKGWIALGDRATGFFAFGGIAQGVIAIGGLAWGGIAIGGMAVGLVSLGGCTLGLLAIGGIAIGYDAIGGGTLAWNAAIGGGSVAYHVAIGGVAIAHDLSISGAALAQKENLDTAILHAQPGLVRWMAKFFLENTSTWIIYTIGLGLLVSFSPVMLQPLAYRKKSISREDAKSRS